MRYSYTNSETLITDSTYKKLEGKYANDLWKYVAPLSKASKADASSSVYLKAINSRLISASLVDEGSVIETKRIKGKIKNGYFSVKSKVYHYGVPFIFFWYYDNKLNITLTKEEQLSLNIKESKFTMIFILSAGSRERFRKIYPKQ
jgi:hypothetical protein